MEMIIEQVIEIVKETMDVSEVTPDTMMQDDLGISSLEFYELLNNLEIEFGIKIPEKILSNVETVEDIANEVSRIMENA